MLSSDHSAESGAAGAGRWRRTDVLLLAPIILFLILLFIVPLTEIVIRSFYSDGLTLRHYREVMTNPVYLTVIGLTFRMVFVVTVLCLLLGYPLAYVMTGLPEGIGAVIRILVIVPLLTSVIVRSYAWMVLLGKNGLVNQFLAALDLIYEPLKLMYNFNGVVVGMVYVMLPFMVLTLESVMRNIDSSLVPAAHNLGASKWQAFWRIFLPLSMPGVVGGGLLVFIMSLGYYITPALLGGPRDVVIAMLIANQVELSMNWSLASAIASLLLVVTLGGFIACNRLLRLQQILESRA